MLATQQGTVKPLSARVHQILTEGRSVDASSDAWSCLLGLLQCGYQPADVLRMARDGMPGFRHYSQLAARRGWQRVQRKILDREIPKARRLIAARPAALDPATVQAELTAIGDAADTRPHLWAARTGTTDRVVLMALVGMARTAGKLRFRASVRQVALAANMRAQTVHPALRRLVADGTFLEVTTAAHGIEGTEYRLRVPHATTAAVELPDDHQGTERTLAVVPDLFARTSRADDGRLTNLGPGVGVTYALLTGAPTAAAQLVKLTARGRATIYEHLAKLAAAGLAQQVPGGWVRTGAQVADVTVKLGAKPVRQIRRELFDRARAWFQQRFQAIQRGRADRRRAVLARRTRPALQLIDGQRVDTTTGEVHEPEHTATMTITLVGSGTLGSAA